MLIQFLLLFIKCLRFQGISWLLKACIASWSILSAIAFCSLNPFALLKLIGAFLGKVEDM